MTELYQYSEREMFAFLLLLLRLGSFVAVWPVFGVESVPPQLKALLALALTILIFPVMDLSLFNQTFSAYEIILLSAKEVLIGLFFGFLTRIFFSILRMAGEMISVNIGLSGAQLYNPAMGGMASPIDTFFYTLGAMVFLMIQGHHFFLVGIIDTFRMIPIHQSGLNLSAMGGLGGFIQGAVVAAISMAAPVFVAILFANIAMGVLGKTVPQINVLITSLAVNAILGFVVLILAMPSVVDQMERVLESSMVSVFKVMRSL